MMMKKKILIIDEVIQFSDDIELSFFISFREGQQNRLLMNRWGQGRNVGSYSVMVLYVLEAKPALPHANRFYKLSFQSDLIPLNPFLNRTYVELNFANFHFEIRSY